MDAVASSVFVTKFTETCALHNSPSSSIRAFNERPGSLKISKTTHCHGLRVFAHARVVPGGEDEESKPLSSGFGFLSEGSSSLSRVFI